MLYGLYQAVLEKKQREAALRREGEEKEKEEEKEEEKEKEEKGKEEVEEMEREAAAEVSKVLGKRIRFISTGLFFFFFFFSLSFTLS